jgi:hypothetical protein
MFGSPVEGVEGVEGTSAFRVKLGDREYSPEEATTHYTDVMRRMQAADRNSAAYRERAEQALRAATEFQNILRQRGMLNEEGTLVVESPEDIRARSQGEGEAEPEFEMPRFFQVGEDGDPAATDAFFRQMENVAAEHGLRFSLALFADHMEQTLKKYHERATAHYAKQVQKALAPIMPFHETLAATHATGQFLTQMQGVQMPDGHPAYPELSDNQIAPVFVPRLVAALDEAVAENGREWAYSPKGFRYIVNALRYEMASEQAQQPAAPPNSLEQPTAPAPAASRVAGRPNVGQSSVMVLDGAPSGIPRARTNGSAKTDGDRLLRRSAGKIGGMDFGF